MKQAVVFLRGIKAGICIFKGIAGELCAVFTICFVGFLGVGEFACIERRQHIAPF